MGERGWVMAHLARARRRVRAARVFRTLLWGDLTAPSHVNVCCVGFVLNKQKNTAIVR